MTAVGIPARGIGLSEDASTNPRAIAPRNNEAASQGWRADAQSAAARVQDAEAMQRMEALPR